MNPAPPAVWLLLFLIGAAPGSHADDFKALFSNRAVFDNALAKEAATPSLPKGEVCGFTVPHHLVAADLIARAFQMAAAGDYERVIVLFPDHFRQNKDPFATTSRSFQTMYGRVETDAEAVARLHTDFPEILDSDLFESDHGIHAVLPFIARFFPRAKLLPISLGISSQPEQWDKLVAALAPLTNDRTLIVQSTDFSHYLPRDRARENDQQTLNAIASGHSASLRSLTQPAHLDSKASQYVHMELQRRVHGALPEVIENRNSFEYLEWKGSPTTSYIVQVYRKPSAKPGPIPAAPDQQVFFFAGDSSFGRYLDAPLRDKALAGNLRDHILTLTGGAPLVLNLEGVMLDGGIPGNLPPLRIAMDSGQSIRWLKSLKVAAVSLANNHTLDFGSDALVSMKQRLQAEGIVALGHGESHDFGAFRLLALRDVDNHGEQRTALIGGQMLQGIREMRLPQPAVAFVHWGREYDQEPGSREISLTRGLQQGGLPFVIGAHPHVASSGVSTLPGSRAASVYSLGNFIFDQSDPRVSGAIAELRVFKQGTCFLRVRGIGNLYRDQVIGRKK